MSTTHIRYVPLRSIAIRQRLGELRGQFLQWGAPELQVLVLTKDKLRGLLRALEW